MKLTAILRIKDQIDTIDECLCKISEVADDIIVVDNGSTDGTLEVYGNYQKLTRIIHTKGFDEGRDKVMLLVEAKKTNPDWILWIDADEVFEKAFTRNVVEKYMGSSYNRVTFRMCNFWLDRERCRYDGPYFLYSLHPQRSMWRNVPSSFFINKKIHNGDIQGVPGKVFLSPYRLKHYGYANEAKMRRKFELYTAEDPSSGRDYSRLNPDKPFKAFVFREFHNAAINYAYICAYKYICNILWFGERVRLKILKFFTHDK